MKTQIPARTETHCDKCASLITGQVYQIYLVPEGQGFNEDDWPISEDLCEDCRNDIEYAVDRNVEIPRAKGEQP